jgi:hypothetical protein
MNENTELLDETLDDLADLPEQALWPAGAYAATFRFSALKDKVGAYVINLDMQQVIELSNPTSEEPAEGDQTAQFIYTRKKDGTANPFGQGQLKKILSPIASAMGTNKIADIIEETKNGVDVIVVVKVQKSKNPDYEDSQEIVKLEMQE